MEKLRTDSITSLFFKYLIPSVTGTLSVGILIFIDTVFIGRGIGSNGLAALNTALPVYTLYSSTGLLLGMGGATAAAVDAGRGNTRGKNNIFSHAVILSVIVSLLYTVLQWIFLDDILALLGTPETLFSLAKSYLGMLSMFTFFYLVPHVLSSFIRNDGNPNLAMVGMVVCGLVNIFFDYIFIIILKLGMGGAALATGISQVVYFLILISHLYSKKNTLKIKVKSFNDKILGRIFKIGLPSFLNDISMGISIFSFNLVLFKIKGDLGVSAYSIILNISFLIYLVFVGISQACQPLISINYGAKQYGRVKETLKLGFLTSIFVALTTIIFLYIFKVPVIRLFNESDTELLKIASVGMPIFFSSSIFMGINIMFTTLFQSIEQSKVSSFLTFTRGLGLIIVGLVILPKFMGIKGVWITPLFAESLALIACLVFYRNFKSSIQKEC